MSSINIYKRAETYVRKLFDEYPHPNLVFHNIEHTYQVFLRVEEIAGHYQLSENEMQVVCVATWFHDVGHLFSEIDKHEEKSIEIMKIFMQEEGASEEMVKNVEDCIWATRIPHEPKNLLQEILCDADTYHFGTKEFKKTNKKVKKELALRNYQTLLLEWEKNTLDLLEGHHFFTSYCKMLLDDGKRENIEWARRKYLKATSANTSNTIFNEATTGDAASKQKGNLVTRGIQTMLRLTSENHLDLSNMADGKANILISVNSIIISVILSVLIRKIETDTYLAIPTITFLLFSVATIVLAILATRPKISEGRFSKNDIVSKRTNLLFFGNFYKSSLDDYKWAMSTMMQDKDYLYGALIQDIHQLGIVLGRKYKLIRAAYNVFMIGIIVSVIAFGIAVAFHAPQDTTIITTPSSSPL